MFQVETLISTDLISEDGQLWMTSRQLAEVFGKAHLNVLRDIDKQNSKLSSLIKSSAYSVPGQSRQYPQYLINRKGVMAISAWYDLAVGVALVDRIEELEKQLAERKETAISGFAIPQTLPDALRLAADLAEENCKLIVKLDHAIATKAQINGKKTATSMATASNLKQKCNKLEAENIRLRQSLLLGAADHVAKGNKMLDDAGFGGSIRLVIGEQGNLF